MALTKVSGGGLKNLNLGSENLTTTGNVSGASLIPTGTSAPTNGVYLSGTNEVAISTGGSGRLFVDASGNVGVGTTSPQNKLVVSNSGAEGIEFAPGSTSDRNITTHYNRNTLAYTENLENASAHIFSLSNTERCRIGLTGSSANFLIGTSSPYSLYYSQSNGLFTARDSITLANGGNGPNYGSLHLCKFGIHSYGSNITFFKSRSSTIGSGAAVSSGDNLGTIDWIAATGANNYGAASIKAEVDGTITANTADLPGRLVFSTTADGAGSPTEHMRLDSSGNLKFNSGYGSVATAYGVRAWVNFNGQGPGSIRGNGNVSSFTKNANGDFTVNFTTAMPDANYCVLVSGNQDTSTSDKPLNVPYNTAPSTSAVRIQNSGSVDYQYYMVAVIR